MAFFDRWMGKKSSATPPAPHATGVIGSSKPAPVTMRTRQPPPQVPNERRTLADFFGRGRAKNPAASGGKRHVSPPGVVRGSTRVRGAQFPPRLASPTQLSAKSMTVANGGSANKASNNATEVAEGGSDTVRSQMTSNGGTQVAEVTKSGDRVSAHKADKNTKSASSADGKSNSRSASSDHSAPSPPEASLPRGLGPPVSVDEDRYRFTKFSKLVAKGVGGQIDIARLRKLSWQGIPPQHRCLCWKLMLGYAPLNAARREATLRRRRREYWDSFVPKYFHSGHGQRSTHEQETLRQVLVDVPRTCPDLPLFAQSQIRRLLERALYIWALRHPASGYVQGINDLITPFILVFLDQGLRVAAAAAGTDSDQYDRKAAARPHSGAFTCDVGTVDKEVLRVVEADSYWCLERLVNGVQENYTPQQIGVQRMMYKLRGLVQREDTALHKHFEKEDIKYELFAFRWINCLLMREISLRLATRLFDTYIAEGIEAISDLHVYVCAALLKKWAQKLMGMPFQDILTFLQAMPTEQWTPSDIEMLLAKAYQLKCLYGASPSHLQ